MFRLQRALLTTLSSSARTFSPSAAAIQPATLTAAYQSLKPLLDDAVASHDADDVLEAKRACLDFLDRYNALRESKQPIPADLPPLVNNVKDKLQELLGKKTFSAM